MKTYKAPWSVSLIVSTAFATALCMGLVGAAILLDGDRMLQWRIQTWHDVLPPPFIFTPTLVLFLTFRPALGAYRAYVTNPHRTVVLEFSDSRKVIISPETPEEFVDEIGLHCAKAHAAGD